ncbi:MAG: S8 family serine peptidase [Phycisphaerae bacterium]|jgi:hypothetical protein
MQTHTVRVILSSAAAAVLGGTLMFGTARADAGPGGAFRPAPAPLQLAVGDADLRALPNLLVQPPAAFRADRRYVLQLSQTVTAELAARLGAIGVALGENYLPPNTYIVDLSGVSPAALAAVSELAFVGEYQSGWRIAPGIGQREYFTEFRRELAAAGQVAVDITLLPGMDVDLALNDIESVGAVQVTNAYEMGPNWVVTALLPAETLPALAGVAAIQFVEEMPEVTLRNNTTRWIVQSNVTNVTPLYDNGIHGEGQIVGMMDGKLDVNHCSFDDTVPPGPDHRKIVAYNTSQGADLHGTHTSGTAVGDNGDSTATRGIAYLGKIAFDDIPSFTDTAMYNTLLQHHNQGARMHTNSWGNDGTVQYDGLCRGIDRFSYDFEDSLVFFAVTNTSSLKNPENAKNLVAVGASQDTPNQANHCSGGAGPTNDGRRKPEIYAPGCSTVSASAGTSCSTTSLTGTSMASPAVCGTGCLVRQYFTDGFYPTGVASVDDQFTPSGALVKAVLLNSAVDMTGVSGYPSNTEGWGRVLAGDALYFPGDTRKLVVEDVRNANGLSTGNFYERQIDVLGSGEKLKVTLVWTDPPAASGANPADINDLDLEVYAPDATLYRGNVFSGGISVPGGTRDDKNNVEQVHVNSPATGTWTVRVVATAVTVGLQGYSIAVTGDVSPDLPPLTIDLPNGAPTQLAPGVSTSFDVEIVPGTENLVPASLQLVYRYDGGSYQTSLLAPVGGDIYQATLPPPSCGDTPEFYITASGDGGSTRTEPPTAPASVFTAAVGVDEVYFEDAMETDLGWSVGAPDDTATLGIWDRADPQGTVNASVQVQPEDDHTAAGVACWVTDSRAGATAGVYDVDGGKTTLYSPVIDLAGKDADISYWRWYSNSAGSGPNEDTLLVDITNDGSTWVNAETVGPSGAETQGGWIFHQFRVSDFVTPTANVRLRFVASDVINPSLVEAAIDDFLAADFVCVPDCPADLDGDGDVDLADLSELLTHFGGAGTPAQGDLDGDGDIDLADLSAMLEDFGLPC